MRLYLGNDKGGITYHLEDFEAAKAKVDWWPHKHVITSAVLTDGDRVIYEGTALEFPTEEPE